MTVTTKPLGSWSFDKWSDSANNFVPSGQFVSVTGRFENASTNNHWYRELRKGLTRDVGSNWTAFSSGIEMCDYDLRVLCNISGTYQAYRGPMLVGHNRHYFDETDFFNLPLGYTSEEDLAALGSTAVSFCIPTNPIVDLPVAVAELLSEGLPAIPGMDVLRPRRFSRNSIPGNYLNLEFGIKPFLSDLIKFRDAAIEAEKLISQYVSDSGTVIRRGYEFPVEQTTEVVVHPATSGFEQFLGGPCNSEIYYYLTTAAAGWPGEMTDVIQRTKKTWFKGAFTYYLPPVGNSLSSKLFRQEALLRHLYGGISAETAWNLLPYSWLADWFTNAGDVIHNISMFARDGLVMPWGYVMESLDFKSTRTVRGAKVARVRNHNGIDLGFSFPPVFLPDVSTSYTASYKRRRKATPFGFGLTYDGLTSRQKAILGALVLK